MILRYRRQFWACFIMVSAVAGWLSYHYIGQVYSLVTIPITADRHDALANAYKIGQALGWDLDSYQQMTSFESEDELQCFVELEAGGKDAFVRMFQSGDYHPYQWHVRFFKEKEVVEMHVWFSPQGQKLGFYKKTSEESAGAALSKEQAHALLMSKMYDWCPDFDQYQVIEYDCETKPTGRIDHDFTYERKDISIGKGFYRFRAVVCGDEVTRLEPAVKVPDNFIRRYHEMRSANNLLAAVGSFFFRALYMLCFGLFGLLYFYRRNYLLTKQAAIVSLCIAAGMLLRGFSDFPLWWSAYNTVHSMSIFIMMKLFEQLISFISLFAMILLVLVVAEAAGRFVYKNHVQFFQLLQVPVLGSYQVVEQIILGYLLVPILFLFVVVFGYLTKTYLGWWSPAGSLSDPNILACYFPWLAAVSISLFAGFFEEVICRALPLSMIVVLTKQSRYKNLWYIGMFIVQALIFGACHANYPNQPFYTRLVELIPVSFLFGWLYMTFGLLPGIITHFVYDAVWFSMPIFASTLFGSQCMVIFLVSLPLLAACFAYGYQKKLHTLPARYYNVAFPETEHVTLTQRIRIIQEKIPAQQKKAIILLGIIGGLLWIGTYAFKPDCHPLLITRADVVKIAHTAIADRFNTHLDASWTPLITTYDDASSTASRFMWQVYGPAIYHLAEGSYINGISWLVRFVKFSGAVEDKGEEYAVAISSCHLDDHQHRQPLQEHAGHVLKAVHTLPEHFEGKDITQTEAETIAYDFIEQHYALTKTDLSLISVNSDKFDYRRDWTLIFQDTQIFDFTMEGQARILVTISGDKVTQFSRFIFVPESWDRADQERNINLKLVNMVLWILLMILTAIGFIFGIFRIMTSRLGSQMFKHKALYIMLVAGLYSCNALSVIMASFTTAEPFYDQLVRVVLTSLSQISWQALFFALLLAAGAVSFSKGPKISYGSAVCLSTCAALFMRGVSALALFYEPHLEPVVGNYIASCHWLPVVSLSTSSLKILYISLSLMISMFMLLKAVRARFPQYMLLQFLVVMLYAMSLEVFQVHASGLWIVLHGTIMGIAIFILYKVLLQYDMTLLPLIYGISISCSMVPHILYPAYVGASLNAGIACVVIVAVSLLFYEWFHKE